MKLNHNKQKKKSIFRTIFVPLIFVMILQGAIFYFTAVYGGIEESLNQNAADIMKERLTNRKNEIETKFNKDWAKLDVYASQFNELYEHYCNTFGDAPFVENEEVQMEFLEETVDILIHTLRTNQVNGVFLILNDQMEQSSFSEGGIEKKYGLHIRDMDPTSAYTGTEDLLLERAPASMIDKTKCSLDSWWEAVYKFTSVEQGDYFYYPLQAAWENQGVKSTDIAYFSGAHQLDSSDLRVVSYSIPLMDQEGKPYAVLGIELTTKYLASLLPSIELNDAGKSCYILATKHQNEEAFLPITTNGVLFSRCFESNSMIYCDHPSPTGGFDVLGRGDVMLYGDICDVDIYNNNNPFEEEHLVLVALVEKDTLYYYSQHVKKSLLVVSIISLLLGVSCIFVVSHHFAAPITALAMKARKENPQSDVHLEHLGITEIDQLVDSIEELSQNVSKEIARTEFFSRMSHDMRTPMNAIISFSSKEMLDDANEKQKDDYLKKINESGVYLLGLINEVLDMTKIESNKVDIHLESIAVDALWNMVISIVDKLAQERNIKFVKEIIAPKDMYVQADAQHLNQIMINLLSNAVKFTPRRGTVTLKSKIEEIEEQTDKVKCLVEVKDTGIGMSEEFMQRLYQPFEQENEGNGGTGLGLSISKKLVELMGGSITCVSKKGSGTTFYVELIFDKGVASKANEEVPKGEFSDIFLCGKRILLCEDHPLNTQIARKLLERKGIVVDNVTNGQDGVNLFRRKPEGTYQAILMDIRMPVLDGLHATSIIRHMERSDAKKIPIIAMTANAFEEDVKKSRSVGMNAHLSKPIEPDKLYSTLEELISQYIDANHIDVDM